MFLVDIVNVNFGSLKMQGKSLIGRRFIGSSIEIDSKSIGKVSSYLISRNELRLDLGVPLFVTFTGNLHFDSLLLTILLVSCPFC